MNREQLLALLRAVERGELDPEKAAERFVHWPFVDTGSARVDTHRSLRHGHAEVVFGIGKTPEQILEIMRALKRAEQPALVTRVSLDVAGAVRRELPEVEYDAGGRLLWWGPSEVAIVGKGTLAVVSAGTADLPVALEAAGVARRLGNRVETFFDVGVAGLHRLLHESESLRRARALIVVAGMEGALPSVVGGLVDKPVIAVPTSVGYGAAFGGLAALLGMLNSCASNVAVVNIDNGFGAAYVASLINRS